MVAQILSWQERYERRQRRRRWQNIVITTWAIIILVAAFTLVYLSFADASWKPQYASEPQAVQDWYQGATLTPNAQKRFGFVPCCDAAEVVKTKFRVDKVNGADHWFYLNDAGAWEQIPDDIVHWTESAPDNKPTLFRLDKAVMDGKVPAGTLTCFYPPGGAI